MDDRHASKVCSRGEADEITDDAAADGDHNRGTIGVYLDERIENAGHRVQILVALAVFDQDRRPIGAGFAEARPVQFPDAMARDQQASRAEPGGIHLAAKELDRAAADDDGIGAAGRRHDDAIYHDC